MKRILAISTLALTAIFATSAREYGGKLSKNVSWSIADSVLTLSGSGATPGYNPSNLSRNPFMDENLAMKFHTIVFDEGITEIGSFLFGQRGDVHNPARLRHGAYGEFSGTDSEISGRQTALYYNLRSVILPSTLRKIGHHAFSRLPVSNIEFPEGLEEIGAAAFANSFLRAVRLPSTLQTLGSEAFSTCLCLAAVDFNYLPLNIPTGAFFNCEKLRIVLHSWAIREIAPSAFDASPMGRYDSDTLLNMFHEDGYEHYQKKHLPARAEFKGSDLEYQQASTLNLQNFYKAEAAVATSFFELDELTLLPYNSETSTIRIATVNHGTLLLALNRQQAGQLAIHWNEVKKNVRPTFRQHNGRVLLQSVEFTLPDSTKLIAAPTAL
ncbi:MAG: leucine-rich repeat domain-containing protein [Muribaculaceae bacterium]|nr:leucine-rich repeat domain-containing protein [Muribaculaceae bacterium]